MYTKSTTNSHRQRSTWNFFKSPCADTLYFEIVSDFHRLSGATDISHFFHEKKIQHCDWYRIINRAMRDSRISPTTESFSRITYRLIIPGVGSINPPGKRFFQRVNVNTAYFLGPPHSFPVTREISLALRNFARLFRNKFAHEFIHSLFGRMKASMYASPIKCRRFRGIRAPQRPNSVDSLGRDSLCLFFFSFTAGSNRRGYPQSAEIIKTVAYAVEFCSTREST